MKTLLLYFFSPVRQILFICFITLAFAACSKDTSEAYQPTVSEENLSDTENLYIFSIHPLHNPTRLHEIFGPMLDYLSSNIENARFQLEESRNYAAYDKKLYAGKAHFSLPNPFQTINSLEHGYRVFAKMGDDHNFRGIILVRKDSNIQRISDLKGKAVSYPAPTALAATMMPQYYIHTHGVDAMKEIDTRYVGSQESSIMNVFLGNVAAGATWPPPWRALKKERPELAEQLEVKWQTAPLPNNGLVAHESVPAELVEQVSRILTQLHTHTEGQEMLKRMELSRFEVATDTSYDPVRDFLVSFAKTVRPLK